jgi:hypothetical protein
LREQPQLCVPDAIRYSGLPALLAICVLAPFANKAFGVDDVTFLLEAQHALMDPLHPAAFEMVFHGERTRVSIGGVSGPVMAYLLVPAVVLGGAEWAAHVVQMILLIVGLVATVRLGQRMGLPTRWARIAGALLVSSPAVLAMTSTAMPDVPAMSFGVLGMERLLAWRTERRWHQGATCAFVFALAVLSRSHLLLLWACGAALITRESAGPEMRGRLYLLWHYGAPLLASAIIVTLVNYITRDPDTGYDLASTTLSRMTGTRGMGLVSNLMSFAAHWALSFPLTVAWVALRTTALLRRSIVGIALVAGSLAYLKLSLAEGPHSALWVCPVTALSYAVLADILLDGWQRRDALQLSLGAWLLIAIPGALYLHLPPKALVPSAPGMAILLARSLAAAPALRARITFSATVLAGVVLGVLIIKADNAVAEIGRRGAREDVAEQVRARRRVWFDGAWGFQWYAMQQGAMALARTPPYPSPGDVVVAGLGGGTLRRFPNKRLLKSWSVNTQGGRIFSEGAGFYSNGSGFLPWTWGKGELGRIDVWLIEPTTSTTH